MLLMLACIHSFVRGSTGSDTHCGCYYTEDAIVCKRNSSFAKPLSLLLLLGGDIESTSGPSNEWLKKQAKKQKYVLQRVEILEK